MYIVEFYSKQEWKLKGFIPRYVKQWYWHARFKKGGIDTIVADSGEGYYNRTDCVTAFENFKKSRDYTIEFLND